MYCCVNLTILSRCGPRSLRSCELSQACAFSTLSHSEMPTRWGASPKTAVTLSLTTRAPPAFFVAVGYPGSKGERVSPCGIRGYARAMCTTSWPSGGCRVICPLRPPCEFRRWYRQRSEGMSRAHCKHAQLKSLPYASFEIVRVYLSTMN